MNKSKSGFWIYSGDRLGGAWVDIGVSHVINVPSTRLIASLFTVLAGLVGMAFLILCITLYQPVMAQTFRGLGVGSSLSKVLKAGLSKIPRQDRRVNREKRQEKLDVRDDRLGQKKKEIKPGCKKKSNGPWLRNVGKPSELRIARGRAEEGKTPNLLVIKKFKISIKIILGPCWFICDRLSIDSLFLLLGRCLLEITSDLRHDLRTINSKNSAF